MFRAVVLVSGLALVGSVVFGAVYGIGRADNTPDIALDTHEELMAGATLLASHADAMRDHGRRLMEAGDPRWAAVGEAHQMEAVTLDIAAEELRRVCRDLALFPADHAVRLERVRGGVRAINRAGELLIDHVVDMERLSRGISVGVADPDAELLRVFGDHLDADMDTMISQGRALLATGQRLTERTDRLERSLAR